MSEGGAQRVHLPVYDDGSDRSVEHPDGHQRPRTREECRGGPRPCPWVGCGHHLAWSSVAQGTPAGLAVDRAVDQLSADRPSCVLDVIDAHPDGLGLAEVGELFGVTRERIRQIEFKALERLPRRTERVGLSLDDAEGTCEADELPTAKGHGHTRAAVFETGPRQVDTPPQHRHLPTVHSVEAGERFWCGVLGAVVTTHLCGARHVARRPTGQGRYAGETPSYPECAECSDGAALRARLAGANTVAPASAIRFFGDEEEVTPAASEAACTEEDHVESSTSSSSTTSSTVPASTRCAAEGCSEATGEPRVNTLPEHRAFCPGHRQRARDLQRRNELTPAQAAEHLRTHKLSPITRESRAAPVKAPGACPVPSCDRERGRAHRDGPPEFQPLCPQHRARARDILAKCTGYTAASAFERVVTGQVPASVQKARLAGESSRPAKAPQAPQDSAPARTTAPVTTDPLATIRASMALVARLGGVERAGQVADAVEQLGGAGALAELVALAREGLR